MPSILPGYEYDIFISYRHNDNQDGWVTRFVEALQKELKATLKNEVSIYFDENPHDGLLETHLVDASLEKKLKCLVFIPIVSQTYCDERSFAWEHEFMPFIEMAKQDELGVNITLSNGNVVSRVLPIKIHELDTEDQHILEAVLDGPLRSIDFIYRSAGVNRPLRINEDDPTANLNKTFYRDQLNKVANALKDIGNSILNHRKNDSDDLVKDVIESKRTSADNSQKSTTKNKLLIPIAFVVVMALAFFLVKPLLFKGNEVKDIREVGLAIMPLKNISNNPEIVNLSFALKDQTQNILSLTKKFAFLSSSMATAVYKDMNISPQKAGEELGVDYVLAGMFDLVGDRLKVNVELVDTRTGRSVWSDSYDKLFNEQNINPLQTEIAQKVLAIFNESDEKIVADNQNINFESYDYYIKGLEWMQKGWELDARLEAIREFEQAINLDSTHTQSWIELIECKSNLIFNNFVEKDQYLSEIESHLDFLSKNHPQWASELAQGIYHYYVLGNYEEGLRYLKKVIEYYPDNEIAKNLIASIYKRKLKVKEAYNIRLKLINSDPKNSNYWAELSVYFRLNGDYKRQLQSWSRALELGLDSAYYLELRYIYQKASIPLDSIPAKYRASNNKDLLLTKIFETNNARMIIEQLKEVPLDEQPGRNNFTKTELYSHLARYYFVLALDDSARYYANLCIAENEQQDEKEWAWVGLAYGVLGNAEKAIEIYLSDFPTETEDLLDLSFLKRIYIQRYVLSKNYEMATKLLLELNSAYPEFGDFYYLNHIVYDRAKEEYPPFAEAVANLKLPPPLVEDNQLERLKY